MASNRIKGITIEIDGNVTKLQSALSDVNKDLRTTQSALRDVNKLLKLDPTNTELLKQKQELLRKAIEETKKKLETEKEALKQLKSGDQTPEIIAQQQALERQIAEDENALKGLKNEFSSVKSVGMSAFSAVGEQVKEVGKKITSVGEDITKKVTVPLAAIAGASIAAFKSVDEGYDEIIKKTGATGEAADELREIMESIATEIPTDFKAAGSALGEVQTRFGVTGDELEDLTKKFIMFAYLNDTDVVTAIDKVQSAMAAFGVSTDDAGAFLDTLNKAGQETGVTVDTLASDMTTNAVALKELGMNASDSAKFISKLNKNGIDTSSVLTGMKKALAKATKDGNTFEEEIAIITDRIKNAESPTIAYSEAIELFGTKAGPQLADAIREGRLSFEELGTSIFDNMGNIDATFEETLDPIDKFKTVLNQLKIIGADVGGKLLETLTPMLEKAGEFIAKIQEKWESLSPETQEMIIKIGLIAAAIGPIITILGTLVTAIGALMSPIGLVVLAIGAAIAAGVALYQNWDEICAWAEEVKEKVIQAWETLKEKVVKIFETIKDTVTEVWENIKSKVLGVVDTIKSTVTEKFNAVKTKVTGVWDTLKQNTSTAWNSIKSTIQQNGGGIQGVIRTAWEGYKSIWQGGLSFLNNITGGKLSSIYNWFHDKFEAVKNFVSGIVEWLKGIFNFQWSLPNIQLPHFNIVWHDLGHGIKLPWIGVEWYKKAYDQPYLFTDPTVVGGRGFGDGGGSGEIVYGRDQLMRDIAEAATGDITINVYASEGMNVNQLADKVSARLALVQRQRASAYA